MRFNVCASVVGPAVLNDTKESGSLQVQHFCFISHFILCSVCAHTANVSLYLYYSCMSKFQPRITDETCQCIPVIFFLPTLISLLMWRLVAEFPCVCVCALHTWYVCCVEEACLCVSWWALSSRFTSRGIAPASLSDAWLAGHSARFRMSPTVAWTQKRDQDLFLKVIHVANPNGTSCYCLSIHSSALKFADQSVVLHI